MKTHFISIINRFAVVVALLAVLLSSALQVTTVQAAGIVVNSAEDTDTVNVDDGKCTLREAIIAANSDLPRGGCAAGSGVDTITFAGNYTITVGGQLPYITTAMTITGTGAANTIIQAAAMPEVATWRVLQVTPAGNLALDGVTVRNGSCIQSCTAINQSAEPDSGGGIYNSGALTLTNSIVSGNHSFDWGGGIYNSGTLSLTHSTLSGNSGDNGGGIFNSGTLTVTISTVSGNSGTGGGGIFNSGILTVTNSAISGNTAIYCGGGILNWFHQGTITLTNSTVSGNTANGVGGYAGATICGGGIYSDGVLTVVNSTFTANSASNPTAVNSYGGAIANAGTLTMTNATISGNTASGGGAVWGGGIVTRSSGTTTLKNTIVAHNTAGNCVLEDMDSVIINGGYNLDSGSTCGFGFNNGSMSNTNPLLGPLANNGGPTQTMALLPGSPAFERGSQATPGSGGNACPATDQRGIARPQGIYCDIGAYENTALIISGNAGVAGLPLNYTDGTLKTVIADGNGNYSLVLPMGWSGTVTPAPGVGPFCPSSQSYVNVTTNKTLQNYTPAACPNFGTIAQWSPSFDLGHGWTVSDYVRTVGDVSGDGRADVVGFGQDGVYVSLSVSLPNGTNAFGAISKWTNAFDLAHGWTVSNFVRTVGDVNGDGRADLVGFGQDGVYVSLSTGSSFLMPSKWVTAFDLAHGWTVKDYVRTVGDVSGDGMADLVGFGLDGVYVSISTGSGFFLTPKKWTSAFNLSHGWTVKDYVRTVGDVNGDGKADLVGFGLDGVYVSLSTGGSFPAPTKWTNSFALANGWTVSNYVRTVGDVNRDGKADIVGFGQDGVYIGLSIGNGFSLPSRRTTSFDLSHGWTVSQYVRTVGDVNGSGQADLVGFGLDGVYISLSQ